MTESDPAAAGATSERLTSTQFAESSGVEDWRVIWGAGFACAYFATGSFQAGVALVQAIGELAAAASHDPDIDLRPEGVTVRLFSAGTFGVTERDVSLARQISAAARRLQAPADPSAVQHVQISTDALDIARVRPFWHAVLGYPEVGDADLLDARRSGPPFWFQQMDAERPQRNRVHIDIYVPQDQVHARIGAALAAGGRIVSDAHAPGWWTLADPEGNECDLAVWG